MKILKYLFLLIFIVVAGTAIYIAITDRNFKIEESVVIKAPQELAFKQVNHLNNWKNWYWTKKDSSQLQLSVSKKESGKNAKLKWENDSLKNKGLLLILSTQHYSLINQSVKIKERYQELDLHFNWRFQQKGDSTFIRLNVSGEPNYWAKTFGILKGSSPKESCRSKLSERLKRLAENIKKDMQVFSIEVEGVAKNKMSPYIYNSFASENNPELITKKRLKKLNNLIDSVEKVGLSPNGSPFMIFNKIDNQNKSVIASIAIPIPKDELQYAKDNGFIISTLPAHEYITSTLKGDYKNIIKLWDATKIYMQQNGLAQDSAEQSYELYKVTERDSKNPADWVTQLYIPVKSEKTEYDYPTDLGI